MKKMMLILAMGMFGFATTQAMASPFAPISVEKLYQDDKAEIDPADLPQAVKDAIENDTQLSNLEITKAFQVTKGNELFYKVKFDGGLFGEEITKKFSASGEEVTDGKRLEKRTGGINQGAHFKNPLI